jgi:hypothetical protein
LYGSSFTQIWNWEFGYWSGFSKLQNSDSDFGFENQTWFQSSFREPKPYLVTFFRFETFGSGKEVLHPLRKHLLRTQESSKLRTLHAINQTSSIHASIRRAFRWLWINGGNFSIQNWEASRAVFFSVSLVDQGMGPLSTLLARALPSFGMNRDNISII